METSDSPAPIFPLSARPTFTALPSNPDVPATREQLQAYFAGNVDGAIQLLIALPEFEAKASC